MNKADEPAFPIVADPKFISYGTGLTKREYFAAMAMQGITSNGVMLAAMQEIGKESGMSEPSGIAVTVRMSVIFADALILALNRKESKNADAE